VPRRNALVKVVEVVSPAVVNISTSALVGGPGPSRGSLFDRLFGGSLGSGPREVPNSLGSGVIVDPGGFVVTNEHVIAAAARIEVTLLDGRRVEAEFVGSAADYDLAVIRLVEPGPWPYLSVEFRESLHAGETVLAIGNPFGHESTVTSGILSGVQRQMESGGRRYTDFLQTDAAINPGNSGGALLTVNGDLIGIPTVIDARAQNIGFAIPVARVRKVLDELIRFGEVRRVWLGIGVEELDDFAPFEVSRLGVPGDRGLLVTRVWDDLAGDRAGLQAGDVILEVDDAPVREAVEFDTALSRIRLGDPFSMSVWREGRRHRIDCVAEAVPLHRGPEYLQRLLGLELRERLDPRGRPLVVVEAVRGGGAAAEVGLVPGLAVLRFGDSRPGGLEDVHEELFRHLGRRQIWLVVSDGREAYRVKLRF
jgi:serine protease Do